MPWKFTAAALALILTAAPATATPPPYTAFYEATAYGNTLKTRSSVNYEPGRVRMSLDARVVGFLRLLGRFEMSREAIVSIGPEGLRLLESLHSQVQPRRSREVHTRFDWETGRAEGVNNGEPFSLSVSEDTMDYLSVLLAIMQELQTGTAAQRQTVEVIERDRVRSYRLVREGTERIRTELGRLDTVKVTRRDDDRGIALSAWFARDLHYIPVRFDYEADGRVYVLNITELDWH
ncbi:hypothetical protein B1C78_05910 [Thioalkalivibrio denitrificans]|uniref:DUF3108 domain-containing protein n=1 Tax=Thioalkalivibrio denitrificans TaxID=108003 RepID=A0A1V3NM28_9GAMM|nr:DUF3108 domain-containing protein [Thioalkalivibrio denitrificans]OOG25902.1 hypothetical protein B1C78_05910 [Thioalkalivibrio denitrificans]